MPIFFKAYPLRFLSFLCFYHPLRYFACFLHIYKYFDKYFQNFLLTLHPKHPMPLCRCLPIGPNV